MGKTINERGAPRRLRTGSTLTFDSGFEHGIDPALWTGSGYPWIEDDPERGRQHAINEERQFYLGRRDVLPYDDFRPWFVNDDGHLVLRCVPTPPRYAGLAFGVLDRFEVVTADAKRHSITIAGRPWFDLATGTTRVGVHRELLDNPVLAGPGLLMFGDSPRRLAWLRIEHEHAEDPPYAAGVRTRHRIELIEDVPDWVVPGTVLTLLRRMPFVSGMLTTRGAFAQTWGSWHVCMRMPAGRSTLAGALAWPDGGTGDTDEATLHDNATGVNLLEQPGHYTTQYHGLYTPFEDTRPCALKGPRGVPVNYLRPSRMDAHVHHRAVVIGPGHPHHVDARGEWVEVIWDWYPDDTCAWFVKVGDVFLETARCAMPSSGSGFGARFPRMIILKMAFDSFFNRACELADQSATPRPAKNAIRLRTPPPWDLEIAFVRVSQWRNLPLAPSGAQSAPAVPAKPMRARRRKRLPVVAGTAVAAA